MNDAIETTRTYRVTVLATMIVLAIQGVLGAAALKRPNIVFFLTDDHAAQAIGCYGSQLMKTPNLDRIAKAGMRFDYCFCTESLCAPSRAAILTGKYGHITGGMAWQRYDRKHKTFPEYLQQAGYQMAMIGKYHLGQDPPGFDYYDILPGQGRYHNPEFISKAGKHTVEGHVSDVVVDLALTWLEARAADQPFCICINDKATHMPWRPAKRFESLFAGESIPEPPTLHTDHASRAPVAKMSWLRVEELLRWQERDWGKVPAGFSEKEARSRIYQQYMKHYLGCVAGIDHNVGRVLDWLDRNGLTRDTIVIYSSDQGFFLGEHGWFDKRWMMEESLRMPLLVQYPPLVEPGSECRALVQNIDFAPTLLDLAGVDVPSDIQGRSLRPLLAGKGPADWRKAIYYHCYIDEYGIPPQYGIRTDRWKLVHYQGTVRSDDGTALGTPNIMRPVDQWELFDLTNDPAETTNLYNSRDAQNTIAQLKKQLAALQETLKDDQ